MEAMNEIITDEGIDDTFIAKPPRYNLAIFTIVIFTIVEFFFSQNQILGWLGLAAASAILAILSVYFATLSICISNSYAIPTIYPNLVEENDKYIQIKKQ